VTALRRRCPIALARLVRIEHTVFALPFAYVGALLASTAGPGSATMGWITLAMVGARDARDEPQPLDRRGPRRARTRGRRA
jgi:4-hydroxybenzoate polyprenyltransferase